MAPLWEAAYGELKHLARARLRRSGPLTVLDTTAMRSNPGRPHGRHGSDSTLYREVFERADQASAALRPRALVPDIQLHSPKITRKLTTAWFAQRVQARYARCLARQPTT